MSDLPTHSAPAARYGWIRPWWFLSGFAIGLGCLAYSGWRISGTDYHPGFLRFHSMISPEGSYYPTLDEMCAIVRAKCRPDQVLVVVGGNSILLGVWQKSEDLWSERLQKLLGDKYCVVNFAYRGASPADGGAVVAEALRTEFPRQILIVNEAVVTGVESVPHGPYRYIFWQAYDSGKLMHYPERDARVEEYRNSSPEARNELLETRVSVWFDEALHYHDLWNWVTMEYFGTVASYREQYFPLFLRAHGTYEDQEVDGTDPKFDDRHYPLSSIDIEMKIVKGPSLYYTKGKDGHWNIADLTLQDLSGRFAEAFAPELKPRTLVLVSGSSPYYTNRLSPDDRDMVRQADLDTLAIWRAAGYTAIDYGWDFESRDFGDRTHLTKYGGWKLAAKVAPQITEMAERLGYLK